MLIQLQFWEVDIWDIVEVRCRPSEFWQSNDGCSNSLFSCIIIRVTRTAVSVVICTGPKRRPSNPLLRSSEVLSTEPLDY